MTREELNKKKQEAIFIEQKKEKIKINYLNLTYLPVGSSSPVSELNSFNSFLRGVENSASIACLYIEFIVQNGMIRPSGTA